MNFHERIRQQKEYLEQIQNKLQFKDLLKAREFDIYVDRKNQALKDKVADDAHDYLPRRRNSLIEDPDLRYRIYQRNKAERKSKKKYGFVRKNFQNKDYFKTIFPLIK